MKFDLGLAIKDLTKEKIELVAKNVVLRREDERMRKRLAEYQTDREEDKKRNLEKVRYERMPEFFGQKGKEAQKF